MHCLCVFPLPRLVRLDSDHGIMLAATRTWTLLGLGRNEPGDGAARHRIMIPSP